MNQVFAFLWTIQVSKSQFFFVYNKTLSNSLTCLLKIRSEIKFCNKIQ